MSLIYRYVVSFLSQFITPHIYDLNILHYIIDTFIHLYIINTIQYWKYSFRHTKENLFTHIYTLLPNIKKKCNNNKKKKNNNNDNNFIYG